MNFSGLDCLGVNGNRENSMDEDISGLWVRLVRARARLLPLALVLFSSGAWGAENAEDSAWWYPHVDPLLYVPF